MTNRQTVNRLFAGLFENITPKVTQNWRIRYLVLKQEICLCLWIAEIRNNLDTTEVGWVGWMSVGEVSFPAIRRLNLEFLRSCMVACVSENLSYVAKGFVRC